MSEKDELSKRIDELEKTIFQRLNRLERQVFKDEVAVSDEAAAIRVEAAEIESDVRSQLESIAVANAIRETAQAEQSATPAVEEQVPAPPPVPRETPQWVKNLTDVEWLTSRIGISLLLIGVVTVFFWLNDQPWVTDIMRLGTGYGIGAILLGLGMRLSHNRPNFGQLLAGGGIAAAYITTFIGDFYFNLISDFAGVAILFVTTVIAYGIAVWKQQTPLAYVGLIFGLLTPFVLDTDDPSLSGFAIYACLILLGPIAIYYTLRWRGLLFVAAAFAWMYVLIFADQIIPDPAFNDQLVVQGVILFSLVGFGVIPLVRFIMDRYMLKAADIEAAEIALETAATAAAVSADSEESAEEDNEANSTETIEPDPILEEHQALIDSWQAPWTLFPHIAATPILAGFFSLLIWPDMNPIPWAAFMVIASLVCFAGGYLLGEDKRFEPIQLPLLIAGAGLLLMAPFQSSGNFAAPLLIIFSVEALGFAFFARQKGGSQALTLTFLLFFGGLITWAAGILPESIENPFLNLNFFASIIFVASLAYAAHLHEMSAAKIIYQFFAHLILLPVSGFEMAALFDGETYWLLLHILIHIAVFAAGLFTENRMLRYQAIVFAGLAMLVQTGFDLDEALTWPNLMLFIAAVQVIGVCASGKLWEDKFVLIGGYVLSGIGMIALFARFVTSEVPIPFVSLPSLATLSMLVALLFVALWYTEEKLVTLIIGVLTHILALVWLVVQSQDFVNSQGIITALWAVYSIALLIIGLLLDKNIMRNLGIGTILLTVAKLLLVDLENVSTGGRVLLFSGFGVVLLVISYFTRTLWRHSDPEDEAEVEVLDQSTAA